MTREKLLDELDRIAVNIAAPNIAFEIRTLTHKLRYPLREIIAKIPGENIVDKAKVVPVSRQTMHVWHDERFRPKLFYAQRLSRVTGVPVEHIMEWQDDDAGGEAAKTVAKLAGRRASTPAVHGRTRRVRRRVDDAPARGRGVRAVPERTGD